MLILFHGGAHDSISFATAFFLTMTFFLETTVLMFLQRFLALAGFDRVIYLVFEKVSKRRELILAVDSQW
jgi:hypothetical protein